MVSRGGTASKGGEPAQLIIMGAETRQTVRIKRRVRIGCGPCGFGKGGCGLVSGADLTNDNIDALGGLNLALGGQLVRLRCIGSQIGSGSLSSHLMTKVRHIEPAAH